METMTNTLPVDLKVASPCSARWDDMPGGDTVRSCAKCAHKVYNLSEMSTADAADLIRKAEGRLCVRFYRRADGTIMTKDCPTSLRAVRVRAARGIGVAFASLLVWSGINVSTRARSDYPFLLRLLLDKVDPSPKASAAPAQEAPPPTSLPPRTVGHTMGAMVMLPMAAPTPMPEPVQATMGKVAVDAAGTGKPFLSGAEIDNTPREDPFAPEAKPKKRSAR